MLDNKGFNLWADGYDKSVGVLIVFDELQKHIHELKFEQLSFCAGLLSLRKK